MSWDIIEPEAPDEETEEIGEWYYALTCVRCGKTFPIIASTPTESVPNDRYSLFVTCPRCLTKERYLKSEFMPTHGVI